MKRPIAVLALLILAGCSGKTPTSPADVSAAQPPAVIPHPTSMQVLEDTLDIGRQLHVSVEPGAGTALAALQSLLADLDISESDDAATGISLRLIDEQALGDEGYRLHVGEHIAISAHQEAGLFYGVQTLRQLLPAQKADGYVLPHVEITDTPAYPWRGSMLDVARSFLPPDYLKAHMDRMALFKLNRLHLHLTEDQGWRVEIHAYPRLTEIGGASAVAGGRSGFYTQAELKDLVAYAQARHITLVPEIDLPGHTQAAIASYNELACDDVTNLGTYDGLEVGFSKLCLTKPEVIYPFVTAVLTEVAAIFPSPYLHIGGDEIEDPLYGEFIARAADIVRSLGRIPVAWEEASVADTAPDLLLQLWNDEYDIRPALERGHRLVLSPCSYTYFDHGNHAGQPNTYTWCREQGIPLERAYSLQPENYAQAVGVEAPMWSELVHTDAAADNRLWPRLAAIAEVAWSTPENRDYDDFLRRLQAQLGQLERLGIDYYRGPEPAER